MVEPFKAAELQSTKQWWLGLEPGDLPERVILTLLIDVVPDVFKEQLTDFRHLAGATEYQAYRGSYQGIDVGIVYAGSGAYSATTAIDELARLGVKVLIRVANSGGVSEQVSVGDLVVTTGCVRAERVLLDYVPAEYPAFSDRHIVDSMVKAGNESGLKTHEGLTLTVSSFYPGSGFPTPLGVLDEDVLKRVHLWKKTGVTNIDGETSTLLVLGRLYGMRAGALLGVGNHLATGDGGYISGQDKLVATGLRALLIDAKREQGQSL